MIQEGTHAVNVSQFTTCRIPGTLVRQQDPTHIGSSHWSMAVSEFGNRSASSREVSFTWYASLYVTATDPAHMGNTCASLHVPKRAIEMEIQHISDVVLQKVLQAMMTNPKFSRRPKIADSLLGQQE